MNEALIVQGRPVTETDLDQIRQLIAAHPEWSRRRLSEVLCAQWNWRNGAGRLKDMATRTLLLKLHQRGWIHLPERRRTPTNRMQACAIAPRLWDMTLRHGSLEELGTVQVQEVSADRAGREELAAALAQFHYLGSGGTVGENLQYLVIDRQGRLLAGLLFGSAAWKCRDRDRFIGWGTAQREANLWLTTNNNHYLQAIKPPVPAVTIPGFGNLFSLPFDIGARQVVQQHIKLCIKQEVMSATHS